MKAGVINAAGKTEKNQKVAAGDCIFPFKYKRQEHTSCLETEKGEICATEINPKTRTLTKYGYCIKPSSIKNSPKNKTLKKKLIVKPDIEIVTAAIPKKSPKMSLNEKYIDLMEKLATIMSNQGEVFRARAYQKAQETIMAFPDNITSPEQLKGLPGIGTTIYEKLVKFTKTGTLDILEREKDNPLHQLTKIYGVGPKKAKQLIADGYNSVAKLQDLSEAEKQKLLNKNQIKGLQYFDDIEMKIPRKTIESYQKVFEKILNEIDSSGKTKFEVVGSYRRGKLQSGDIDVIITNSDNNSDKFSEFLKKLTDDGIIEYTFSKGNTKSLTMCKIPGATISRRVDFLYSPPNEYAFAILYFTGSKIFNTVMRQYALKQGYSLNEHGLSKMSSGIKGALVKGDFKTEKDIFDFLGLKYIDPKDRIDGRSVITKDGSSVISEIDDKHKQDKEQEGDKSIPVKRMTVKKVNRGTLKNKKVDFKEMIDAIKTGGITQLSKYNEKEIMELLIKANDAYYNKKSLMSDELFDLVKEYAEREYSNNPVLKAIGAPVVKGKVKLPYNMPSMNKIKPDTGALDKWKKKYNGPYVISAKLDGVSGMYILNDSKGKLYTRGDGTYGQDVSHLIPYLNLPNQYDTEFAIRGEFIISKSVFAQKYGKDYSNARNFVAGLINSKTLMPEKFVDLEFVIYEVIKPKLIPSRQFELLNTFPNLKIVWNKFIDNQDKLTNELLSKDLIEIRDNYQYEIDGIICCDDNSHNRTKDNPEHAFAFKMVLGDQVAEVKVVDVLWSPSKDGYLKPRVQVEPVVLGGAKIEYATGFNAKFIYDNKIGVGAVIQLVRSGDVIPHIMDVIKPAEAPLMPSVPWEWNKTKVDAIMLNKEEDKTVLIKTVTLFFKHLDTAGLGPGNVAKLVSAELKSIPDFINAPIQVYKDVLGKKMGQTVYDNMKEAIKKADLPQLMTASNLFGRGFGDKRFNSIFEAIPNIMESKESRSELVEKLAAIHGISSKSADEFMDKLPLFSKFLEEANLLNKIGEQKQLAEEKDKALDENKSHELYGKRIVMTGFRDKELKAKIEAVGGEVASSVSDNTYLVIAKDKDDDTGKAEKARKLGKPILSIEEFKEKYNM